MFNWYRISMCFTCFSYQFVFNKRFLKIYCLSVYSFFLVSFTSMYTTLKIISRKFLGVNLIWTFFSHVGAIFFLNSPYMFNVYKNQLSRQTGSRNLTGPKMLPTIWYTYMTLVTKYQISAINSYWKNVTKNILDGRKDRRKTVYPPPPSGSGGIIIIQNTTLYNTSKHLQQYF